MHNIYYLGLSGEHRCPLGYLLSFTNGCIGLYMCNIDEFQQHLKFHKIIAYINPSPVALFLSTNTAVAELIFKIYLFIPTKIKNS